ncbi:hypothetical protein [Haloglycomyces albus]|uniref:hypothetical protein n=1 Tax=Haloglycomyces albus TaxID=526067 RepID=UPI0004B8D1C0|nr:hypothetical protein [Haloglycomyces albus]
MTGTEYRNAKRAYKSARRRFGRLQQSQQRRGIPAGSDHPLAVYQRQEVKAQHHRMALLQWRYLARMRQQQAARLAATLACLIFVIAAVAVVVA